MNKFCNKYLIIALSFIICNLSINSINAMEDIYDNQYQAPTMQDNGFYKAVDSKIAIMYQYLANTVLEYNQVHFSNPPENYYNNSDFSDIEEQYKDLLKYVNKRIKDDNNNEFVQEYSNILNYINYLKNLKTIYSICGEIPKDDLRMLENNYLTDDEKAILNCTNLQSDEF